MAILVKFEVQKMVIHSFGGVTIYDEMLNANLYKEILVIIAGPIMQWLFFLLVSHLYNEGLVIDNTYMIFSNINFFLFKFNLLPILPLDGGVLLNKAFDLLISYKYSHIISIVISILFVPFIVLIFKNFVGLVLCVFIIFKIIKEIDCHKYKYNKFLMERYLYNLTFNKIKIIKSIDLIQRNRNHIIKANNIYYKEKEYLDKYFSGLCLTK